MADRFDNMARSALVDNAKAAKISGYSKMKLPELRQAVRVHYDAASMTATEALNADIRDAFAPDEFDAMDRTALCAALAEYELDCEGKADNEVRAELRQLKLNAANDEAAEQARADAEYAKRRSTADADKQAKADQEAALEAGAHPMLSGKPQAVQVHNAELPKEGKKCTDPNTDTVTYRCPHCGKSTRKGENVTDYAEMSPGTQNSTTQQFTCNACAGEWGPVVAKAKKARAPSGSSNGLQIEKDRPSSNGVTRPSAGGKCRGIWDMLDGLGKAVTAAQAREAGKDRFDRTTIMVQFYRWRKFNGIEGRQS